MDLRSISGTDLEVHPLCLGGNVFGWTADEAASFAVLDAYADAGGNFIDTADSYAHWIEGNSGGESEAIIGRWMASRGNRDRIVIATKVGSFPGLEGLGRGTVAEAVEASLRRLGTERIDLLYAHHDDPETPVEEALAIFGELIEAGKVGHVAASNYSAARLEAALEASEREGAARFAALQTEYNLLERDGYEGELAALCADRGIDCIPYYGLARGFLTGKYRPGRPLPESARAGGASAYLEGERGPAALEALDRIAAARGAPVASVALAWLASRPTVAAAIASARTPAQLAELLPMAGLELSGEEIGALEGAAAPAAG